MRTPEEQREERRQYERDVEYEVWRAGGNMDHVNRGRVEDAYYNGQSIKSQVARELSAQRPQPAFDDQQWQEAQSEQEGK